MFLTVDHMCRQPFTSLPSEVAREASGRFLIRRISIPIFLWRILSTSMVLYQWWVGQALAISYGSLFPMLFNGRYDSSETTVFRGKQKEAYQIVFKIIGLEIWEGNFEQCRIKGDILR